MQNNSLTNNLQNLNYNLTKRQKIGILAAFIVVAIILVVLGVSLSSQGEGGGEQVSDENSYEETEDDVDYAISDTDPESTPLADGNTADINTYLPHTEVIANENFDEAIYYAYLDPYAENTINIEIPKCNDNEAKAAATNYLNSIPLDLSAYSIVFESIEVDGNCEI